jgi:hypothetical protein
MSVDIKKLKHHIQLLRQEIDLYEYLYDFYIDYQTELDENVSKGKISDGEYLISSNKNLSEIRETEEKTKRSAQQLKTVLRDHKKAILLKNLAQEDSDSD